MGDMVYGGWVYGGWVYGGWVAWGADDVAHKRERETSTRETIKERTGRAHRKSSQEEPTERAQGELAGEAHGRGVSPRYAPLSPRRTKDGPHKREKGVKNDAACHPHHIRLAPCKK